MKYLWVLAAAFSIIPACGDLHPDTPAYISEPAPQEEVMKIRFQRSGGFAGMMTDVDIDAYSLPDQEREELATLVSRSEFFALPPTMIDTSAMGADRYNYEITIEIDGRTHTVETTDGSAPPTLVPLLNWLNGAARRVPRNPKTEP